MFEFVAIFCNVPGGAVAIELVDGFALFVIDFAVGRIVRIFASDVIIAFVFVVDYFAVLRDLLELFVVELFVDEPDFVFWIIADAF